MGSPRAEITMQYVEALNTFQPQPASKSLFLAGGITGCPDWQRDMVRFLSDTDLVLLNPRRQHFPLHDSTAAEAQIRWEHHYLQLADAIVFWFPWESVCPIALYELGAWAMSYKPLYIGLHPSYPRRLDVEIQMQLTRPDLVIAYTLEALARQIVG